MDYRGCKDCYRDSLDDYCTACVIKNEYKMCYICEKYNEIEETNSQNLSFCNECIKKAEKVIIKDREIEIMYWSPVTYIIMKELIESCREIKGYHKFTEEIERLVYEYIEKKRSEPIDANMDLHPCAYPPSGSLPISHVSEN